MFTYIVTILIYLAIVSKYINAQKSNELRNLHSNYRTELYNDVQFHIYTRKNLHKPYILELGNADSLAHSPLNPQYQTIIFIHGFGESASQTSYQRLTDAYLGKNEYNIIRVDWSALAVMPLYITAVRNARKTGSYVAELVKWLNGQNVLSLLNLHVIGFSLGAHVAGFMAKKLAPDKVARITGLDPAGPMFEFTSASERLDQLDAIFVDTIHTNSKISGIKEAIGHVDFYPNQGTFQPGCRISDVKCSHRRSWIYYTESILNEYGFIASKCETWKPIVQNCTENPDSNMGFGVDPQTRGIFFLKTNSQSPFARNMTDYSYINL